MIVLGIIVGLFIFGVIATAIFGYEKCHICGRRAYLWQGIIREEEPTTHGYYLRFIHMKCDKDNQ